MSQVDNPGLTSHQYIGTVHRPSQLPKPNHSRDVKPRLPTLLMHAVSSKRITTAYTLQYVQYSTLLHKNKAKLLGHTVVVV